MKKYILFGAGANGRKLFNQIGAENIAYICDNYTKVSWGDVESINFDTLKKIHENYKVIITPLDLHQICEISMQLSRANIPYFFLNDIIVDLLCDDIQSYSQKNTRDKFAYNPTRQWLLWEDKFSDAGAVIDNHYFWQDLWAAGKIIANNSSELHFDIGSRLDGFIGHLMSAGQRVCLLDLRPLPVDLPGVEFRQCDATNLTNIPDESIKSLSALCSLEHFGLGRYGDPIDPEACFKCFTAIQRKLASGGVAYISVPVGEECVEFNAHRIFAPRTVINAFSQCRLLEFSVTDGKCIKYNEQPEDYATGGERAGIFGLFMFKKE